MSTEGASGRVAIGLPLPSSMMANIRVDPAKLRDYALDPSHPIGAAKARVFRAVGGIGREDWRWLRASIEQSLPRSPVISVREPAGQAPESYGVAIWLTFPNGRLAPVMTSWVRDGSAGVRLTSTYIDTKRLRN